MYYQTGNLVLTCFGSFSCKYMFAGQEVIVVFVTIVLLYKCSFLLICKLILIFWSCFPGSECRQHYAGLPDALVSAVYSYAFYLPGYMHASTTEKSFLSLFFLLCMGKTNKLKWTVRQQTCVPEHNPKMLFRRKSMTQGTRLRKGTYQFLLRLLVNVNLKF